MTHSDARRHAQRTVGARQPRTVRPYAAQGGQLDLDQVYGSHTFGAKAQDEFLSEPVRAKLRKIIRGSARLDRETADAVAHGMKEWALEKGATHFCHWFQPLTGSTAEKHDAFLTFSGEGKPIARFSGGQLVQGEPDASSFPSGGMRATFEARGYTGWDPSSPAFLMEGPGGLTLCIPSVFVSYHGQVLDRKTPLLRASEAADKAGRALLKLFGKTPERVYPTAGPEQEYFLIDRALVALRPDLAIAHRTVVGAEPPKGQQLEDQYFGHIPDRVIAFMAELDYELYRLGIPAKTRHNEVAPSQFEMAPIFEEANLAADHNQLMMATMRKVARRHDFEIVLHEKPFQGINGSGKHLNWSLGTSDGENLLEPGSTPGENVQFMVVLASVLRAVHQRSGLLRAAIATSGNDFRLGANEAPPAILSVFLGAQLTEAVESVVGGKSVKWQNHKVLDLGVGTLPELTKDTTDRNRTSPFAFTGNKFEFRALGASMSISGPCAYLTAAVAGALGEAVASIEGKMKEGKSRDEAAVETVVAFLKESNPVRFEGDNYSSEWVAEAKKRGLPNLRRTPEALAQLVAAENKGFLTRMGLLSEEEVEAVYHIELDRYVKQVSIEANLLSEMGRSQILPSALSYAGDLAREVKAIGEAKAGSAKAAIRLLQEVTAGIDRLEAALGALDERHAKIGHDDLEAAAKALLALREDEMQEARKAADQLERVVGDGYWPLPKYREMLFPV